MTGKEKCTLLRQIRREIARVNNIPYQPDECYYPGNDCPGTCPKCDAEIRALEMLLNRKADRGERITLAGISLDTYRQSVPVPDFQSYLELESERQRMERGIMEQTPGVMISREDIAQWPLTKLNLPILLREWLSRKNIHSVENLHDLVQNNPDELREQNPQWYNAAVRELESHGFIVEEPLMGESYVETGLIDTWFSPEDEITL